MVVPGDARGPRWGIGSLLLVQGGCGGAALAVWAGGQPSGTAFSHPAGAARGCESVPGKAQLRSWGYLVSGEEDTGSEQLGLAQDSCLGCEQAFQGVAYFSLKMSGMQHPDIQSG